MTPCHALQFVEPDGSFVLLRTLITSPGHSMLAVSTPSNLRSKQAGNTTRCIGELLNSCTGLCMHHATHHSMVTGLPKACHKQVATTKASRHALSGQQHYTCARFVSCTSVCSCSRSLPRLGPQPSFLYKYKTEMCHPWRQGRRCTFGHRCHFAHGAAELQGGIAAALLAQKVQ